MKPSKNGFLKYADQNFDEQQLLLVRVYRTEKKNNTIKLYQCSVYVNMISVGALLLKLWPETN